MKTYEFQGRNVEKAIAQGLKELGKSQYDVDIKILESGGLFKKAKVQITVNDEDDFANQLKSEIKSEIAEDNSNDNGNQEKVVEVVEEVCVVESDNNSIVTETVIEEVVSDDSQSVEQSVVQPKQRVYANNKGTKEFLTGVFEKMGVDVTMEIVEEDEHSKVIISTEKAGLIIGHKGEALSAIQYLANIIEQKHNRYAKRVIVDVADYREKRDDSLKDLADRMARKVLRYKKSIKLNPMNAYDRRIVHTYLQNFKGVTTHSVGVEPHRCLIIDVDRS